MASTKKLLPVLLYMLCLCSTPAAADESSYKNNFYKAVNGAWIESHTIPDDKGQLNSFIEIDDTIVAQSKALIQEMLAKKNPSAQEQKVADYYRSFVDMKARNAKGAAPLKPIFDRIDAVQDRDALVHLLVDMAYEGLPVPYDFGSMHDPHDGTRYVLTFVQSGLGLQKKFYDSNDTAALTKRKNYEILLRDLLTLAKVNDVNRTVANDMKFETMLAKHSYSVLEMSDVKKTTNAYDYAQFIKLTNRLQMPLFFKRLGYPADRTLNVATPPFFKALNTMVDDVPLSIWKDYLKTHTVAAYAGALSEDFINAVQQYNVREGLASKLEPLEVRAVRDISGSPMKFLFGKLYVERYFNDAIKAKVETILHHILDEYSDAITRTRRFSPETKKAALRKIEKMRFNIAYPKKWQDFTTLKIIPNDFLENVKALSQYARGRDVAKVVKGTVDPDMWEGYPPQEVNAYYSPSENKFVLLAGILNPPFFDMNASDALNYGGIGLAIGHEIGHAFDKRGAQFDENGNLKNWWRKEDLKAFEKLNDALIAQANAYEIAPGVHANGKLQVTEIAADLSGSTIALDAYLKDLGADVNRTQGIRDFFIQYAKAWKAKTRPKLLIIYNDSDPHPVAEYRINGTVKNMDAFYEAFGVKEGDGMYLSPEKRVHIW